MRQLLSRRTILHRSSECGIVVMGGAKCGALLGVAAGILALELLTRATAIEVCKAIAVGCGALWREWPPIRVRRNETLALWIEVLTLIAARQRMFCMTGRSSRECLAW